MEKKKQFQAISKILKEKKKKNMSTAHNCGFNKM